MSNTIKLKRGSGSDPSASDLSVGELAIRTDSGKIFTKKDNGSVAEISGGGGIDDGDKGDITVSNGGDTFTINTGAVTSGKILNGTILNADINASAAIAGSKITPTFTSNIQIQNENPEILLVDTGDNPNFKIENVDGLFALRDTTNSANRLTINSSGVVNIGGNLDVGAGVDVTGEITATSHIDIPDSAKIKLGTGDDLNIFHDGSNSYLQNITGNLILKNNSADYIRFINSDASTEVVGNLTVNNFTRSTNGYGVGATTVINSSREIQNVTLNSSSVTATTQSAGNSTTRVATTAFVSTAIANLVDSSPSTLNTLNELAAALGDDANFSTTVTNSIATKLPLAGGTLTGNVTYNDNVKAIFGTNSDFEIFHDGNHTNLLEKGTGNLALMSNGGELQLAENNAGTFQHMVRCITGGAVELYHNGSDKFATNSSGAEVRGNLAVTGTVDGRDVATDGTKLDGIESNATADQTASEILTLLKTVDGAGSGLDADTLDGISSASFLRSNTNDNVGGTLTFVSGSGLNLSENDIYLRARVIQNNKSNGDGLYIGYQNANSGVTRIFGGGSASGGITVHSGAADVRVNNNRVLTVADEGSGNGLDADTVDGIQASSFLRSDADDSFSGTITANSDASSPVIKVQGAGPNFIQFASDSSGTVDADSINLIYRTTPNTLAFERASDATILFSVDADNGQAFFQANLDVGGGLDVTGNISVSGTVDGRDVASDGSKLDGIESGATADQSASEILTLIKTVDGAGSGLDADTLDGISSASFVRSDADDTLSGQYTISDSADEKLKLSGSNSPYIRFQEGTTNKAYIRWNAGGYIELVNQETSESLRIQSGVSGLKFVEGGNTRNVYHTGNLTVGDGGLTENNFTDADHSKLNGIASGATNVTNNNQLTNGAGYITSSDSSITNKLPLAGGTMSGDLNLANNVLYFADTNTSNRDHIWSNDSDNSFNFCHDTTRKGTANSILKAASFQGSGASLTSLNASNISSGTISDARLPNSISSSITGNAATATTLATARTIAGVSFNGSANISLNNNAITNGAGYITSSNSAITNKLPLAGGTMTGELQINARLDVGTGSGNDHEIRIYKGDNNVSDHIQFYNGTTRVGEIGCEDTTWLRINQETNKNIYTPRYIRADNGFFVDGTSKGINGSGNFIGGTIAGASDYSTLLRSNAADTATGDITFSGGAGAVSIAAASDIRLTTGNWAGNAYGKIQHHADRLYLGGGSATEYSLVLRYNSADRIYMRSNGTLYPSADSTSDLGKSGTRWANGYFDTLYGDGSNLTGISAGATGGGSDEVFYENDQTVTTNYTITNGKNAMAAGPITINSGVTVTVGSGETLTIV